MNISPINQLFIMAAADYYARALLVDPEKTRRQLDNSLINPDAFMESVQSWLNKTA